LFMMGGAFQRARKKERPLPPKRKRPFNFAPKRTLYEEKKRGESPLGKKKKGSPLEGEGIFISGPRKGEAAGGEKT